MSNKTILLLVLVALFAAIVSPVQARVADPARKPVVKAGDQIVVVFENDSPDKYSTDAKLMCKAQPGIAASEWRDGMYYPSSPSMPAVQQNCNRVVDPKAEGVTGVTINGIPVLLLAPFRPADPFAPATPAK